VPTVAPPKPKSKRVAGAIGAGTERLIPNCAASFVDGAFGVGCAIISMHNMDIVNIKITFLTIVNYFLLFLYNSFNRRSRSTKTAQETQKTLQRYIKFPPPAKFFAIKMSYMSILFFSDLIFNKLRKEKDRSQSVFMYLTNRLPYHFF
jgi:hypothetical protein